MISMALAVNWEALVRPAVKCLTSQSRVSVLCASSFGASLRDTTVPGSDSTASLLLLEGRPADGFNPSPRCRRHFETWMCPILQISFRAEACKPLHYPATRC